MNDDPDFSQWSCPLPLKDYPKIVLGHGGGGKLSAELVEHLFLPAFANDELARLSDAAVVPTPGEHLAFSTDSFVVHPLFFPGSSIGELAVCGTVNDLAVSGARPQYLSASFILEEGLALSTLGRIVEEMAAAARRAGISIVTGDTKVVEQGRGHGCYITTAGVGIIPAGRSLGAERVRAGDVVLVSGTLGDHGIAVMSVREGLEFGTRIESDSAPLNDLVETLLKAAPGARALRDPTRGGLTSALNEIAASAEVGIELDEPAIPIRPEVQAACDLLGLDPLGVANEGKLVAIVPHQEAEAALESLRSHELGCDAAIVGRAREEHPGLLVTRTAIGGTRVVPMQLGEQLPRIC